MSASKVMSVKNLIARVKNLIARVKIAHASLRDKVNGPPLLRR